MSIFNQEALGKTKWSTSRDGHLIIFPPTPPSCIVSINSPVCTQNASWSEDSGTVGAVEWGRSAPRSPFQQNNFRTHTHTGDGYSGPPLCFQEGIGCIWRFSKHFGVTSFKSWGFTAWKRANESQYQLRRPAATHRPINQGLSWSISHSRFSGKGLVCQRETVRAETEVGRVVKGYWILSRGVPVGRLPCEPGHHPAGTLPTWDEETPHKRKPTNPKPF